MKYEFTTLSVRSREGLAMLFALAVVLAISLVSYRGRIATNRHAEQLQLTEKTITGINGLLLAVTNAETGQRGFLLTKEDRYLEPYRQALADIPILMKSLQGTTRDRPAQAQRVASLDPLIGEKLQELNLTIELLRTENYYAAIDVVKADRGRVLMGKIRTISAEIIAVTNARQALYSQQARSSENLVGQISILGGASLFILLLGANISIQGGVARRQALISRLQQSERRLEESAHAADAANQAKSTFLSTMSHEIRTPMNAILGYAQLMSRDPRLGVEAKANLAIIARSGDHLLALINDVLDMSKIEAGRTELHPMTFNLPQLLKDLEGMFRLRAESKALEFEMLADGESVPYLLADEGKIRQVLINLLGNAIKFTEHGQVTLYVTVERRAAQQLWLSASVADTGSGISAADQEKLFEPFSQASRGINNQEGTGLGLAICRKNARLMGGDVTVSSEPGKGSIFLFETPVETGDAGVALKRSPARRVLGLRAGTEAPKVLVVDDQFENRDWLIKLLTCIGFSVRGAENGQAAIRSWEEWSPRLILMDVHMPVMDGLEATRRIKADPRGKETVIFTLTASALYEDHQKIDQCGADDFLPKPCREDELLEKMRTHLNIAYDYEDLSEGEPPAGLAALSAATLGRLPLELIKELRTATLRGNKRRLDNVILKVGETGDAGSAEALQELADRYDYEALTRLLEQASLR